MNDNHWYPRDPQRYLTDTAWCDHATEVAHIRMIDTYYALGRPIKDEKERIQNIGKIKDADFIRVRGNLFELGWRVEDGFWRHKRIEETIESQNRIRDERSRAGKAGNAVRWGTIPAEESQAVSQTVSQTDGGAISKPVANQSYPQPQPQPYLKPEPLQHTHSRFPTLAEVQQAASIDGIGKDDAEAFWNHFEASGWIDKNGNPVAKWRPKLKTWHTVNQSRKAEQRHHSAGGTVSGAAELVLRQKELERVETRIRDITNSVEGHQDLPANLRAERKNLRGRRDELRKILGIAL